MIDDERKQMNPYPRDEEEPLMKLPKPNPEFLNELWSEKQKPAQTVDEYKQELRDLFFKLAYNTLPETTFRELMAAFGKAVLNRIGDDEDDKL